MFTERQIRGRCSPTDIRRRHMLFALAYAEGKGLFREMSYKDMPEISVPFKPIHYYMGLLPGFNGLTDPVKPTGWRNQCAVYIEFDPDKRGFVRARLSAAYLAGRGW